MSSLLIYFSYFSPLIPLWFVVRERRQKYVFHVGLVALLSLLADLTSYYLLIRNINTAPILNAHDVLQFLLITVLYYLLLNRTYLRFLIVAVCVYGGFVICNTTYWQNFFEMQTWTWTVGGVLFIVYSLLLFKHMLDNSPTTQILTYAPLWINLAVWFYFSFNLFLFLTSSYVFEKLDSTTATVFWSFHNINNIVKNLLFAAGVYYAGKSKK